MTTICLNLAKLQQQASESLNKGEYLEAISIYEHCIEADPTDLTNYWKLGLATLLQGDELTAKAIWLSVLMQGSLEENDIWYTDLSQLLKQAVIEQIQSENFQLAEIICDQILDLIPGLPEVNYYMAICLQRRKEIDNAIIYLKKEIEINPHFAEAYSSLGALLKDRGYGEIEQAIEYIRKAIELKSNLAEAHFNLAVCLHERCQINEALESLEKAIKLKPNFAEAHFKMGICLRGKGEIDKAKVKLQEVTLLRPNFTQAFRAIEYLNECEGSGYTPSVRQGYNFWDAMIFKDDNLYRLFYLIGESSASPFWSVGKLGTAISTDLKKWEYLGVALEPEPTSDWQSGRMLAGSLYKENGVYYFFYSASPPKPLIFDEGIGLATSTDGISWQRSSEQLIKLDPQYYSSSLREGEQRHSGWRDPYLFKDPISGKYYLFITTSFKGEHHIYRGCIGLAVSDKVDGPYTVLPPAACPMVAGTQEGIHYEMERPQVIYREGKYHLFFSASTLYLNPKWFNQISREQITSSSLYWYVSDKVTGPYVPSSAKPTVKGSESTDLYGTSLIEAPDGQLVACGTNTSTLTLEVSTRFPVRWENGSVEILLK